MIMATDDIAYPREKWAQSVAACFAAIATVCVGILEGWTSPALPYLKLNWGVTDEEASWIGSLGGLGALFGSLPAGFLADRIGRRNILLGLSLPLVTGWFIILLTQNTVVLLYAARFILGLAAGAATVVVPIYIEEITEVSIRGELCSYVDLSITIGILQVYAFGAFVPYLWLCVSSLAVPLIFTLLFSFMPESPIYLLSRGKKSEAEKSLRWLRNVGNLNCPDIQVELSEMDSSVNSQSRLCYSSAACRAAFLVLGLLALQQMTGINAVIFYTVDIFRAAGSSLSPYYCTLIIGVVQVVFTYIAAISMDRLGRRILLLASSLGMAASLLLLAIFFLFKDATALKWIPLLALTLYIVFFCIGFGPIPFLMMVELSPTEAKGWISSVGMTVNWGTVFVITRVFTSMLSHLGQAATYAILCSFCVIASVFVYVCIPETKGKSRDEIQAILSGLRL